MKSTEGDIMNAHTPGRAVLESVIREGLDECYRADLDTEQWAGEIADRVEMAGPLTALEQATAALAVVANRAGATHPGLADADNLAAVRAFALESFHVARAALAKAKGE